MPATDRIGAGAWGIVEMQPNHIRALTRFLIPVEAREELLQIVDWQFDKSHTVGTEPIQVRKGIIHVDYRQEIISIYGHCLDDRATLTQ